MIGKGGTDLDPMPLAGKPIQFGLPVVIPDARPQVEIKLTELVAEAVIILRIGSESTQVETWIEYMGPVQGRCLISPVEIGGKVISCEPKLVPSIVTR